MATRYVARSAFDIENDPIGTVFVDDAGVVTKYEPAEDQPRRFSQAVIEKWHIDELDARSRLYTFQPMGGEVKKDAEVQVAGEIVKTDPAKQHVFGWAYITHDKDGSLNIDKSGDFADDIEEIEKSAYNYVLSSRKGDADHTNVATSDLIESIVFTPEKCEQMGIAKGTVPMGWWIGFHVKDAATWERVEKGELRAFSIHGKGTRSKVEE